MGKQTKKQQEYIRDTRTANSISYQSSYGAPKAFRNTYIAAKTIQYNQRGDDQGSTEYVIKQGINYVLLAFSFTFELVMVCLRLCVFTARTIGKMCK